MAEFSQEKVEEMIDLCDQMLDRAYVVYSRFPVAAVLITDCNKIFTGKSGCNKPICLTANQSVTQLNNKNYNTGMNQVAM